MLDRQAILEMEYRINLAYVHVPKGVLTKTAIVLVKVITALFIILVPIEMVTTAVGGCLTAITFGIPLMIFTIIWWPFFIFLMATSWLWLHAWYSRLILLIPGVLIASIADLFVMLAPDPEKDSKHAKLSIAGEWPLSWYLLRPPAN